MIKYGYAITSEQIPVIDVLKVAQIAEDTGFDYLTISDHYFPWTRKQGNSAYAWTQLGALSQVTKKIEIGTAVTCPILRYDPAILAQAAATAGILMENRFFLGVGTGEYLNEHITALGWPTTKIRRHMLEEAVELIKQLWDGQLQSFYGNFFVVENAKIYSLPKKLPPIYIAASGKKTAALAGKVGDGLISTSPNKEIVDTFEETGGMGKPKYGQVSICYANSKEEGVNTVMEWWPNLVMGGALSSNLSLPEYFEQAAKMVKPEDIQKQIACGPDTAEIMDKIQKYIDAGFDHIQIMQIGPNQEAFLEFFNKNIKPLVMVS